MYQFALNPTWIDRLRALTGIQPSREHGHQPTAGLYLDKKHNQIVALRVDVGAAGFAYPYPLNVDDDDDRYYHDRMRGGNLGRVPNKVRMSTWHGRFVPYDAPLPQLARPKPGDVWITQDGHKITVREPRDG